MMLASTTMPTCAAIQLFWTMRFLMEAFAAVVGVFILPLGGSVNCQSVNKYKIWKASHIGLMIADILPKNVQVSEIVIADSHMGCVERPQLFFLKTSNSNCWPKLIDYYPPEQTHTETSHQFFHLAKQTIQQVAHLVA
eukprot:2341243-Amphidinium_carterae.1